MKDMGSIVNVAWLVAIVALVGVGSFVGFDVARAGTAGFWIFVAAPTIVLAGIGMVRAHRDGELGSWLKPVWGDPTRGLVTAALVVVAALLFVHVVAPVGSARESWVARLYLQFGDPKALRANAIVLAASIVVIATAEEILWRGFVTTLIAERWGSRYAWVWSAVLYACSTLPTVWTLRDPVAGLNPVLPVAALALGLLWGWMARRLGRLAPSILSHAAFDWCVVMMFRLWGPSV